MNNTSAINMTKFMHGVMLNKSNLLSMDAFFKLEDSEEVDTIDKYYLYALKVYLEHSNEPLSKLDYNNIRTLCRLFCMDSHYSNKPVKRVERSEVATSIVNEIREKNNVRELFSKFNIINFLATPFSFNY